MINAHNILCNGKGQAVHKNIFKDWVNDQSVLVCSRVLSIFFICVLITNDIYSLLETKKYYVVFLCVV